MRFYIDSDQGFYKDFILGSFVPTKEEAHYFEQYEEAKHMKKALKEVDNITGLVIIAEEDEEDDEIDNEDEFLFHMLALAKSVVEEAETNAAANPSTDEIQVVIVEPDTKPYKQVIKNDLDTKQMLVGGWLENVFIGETETGAKLGIVLNEEGKLIGLPENRKIIGRGGGSDVLVGNLFITAYNYEGDAVSLSDDLANSVIERFTTKNVYLR
jgi:hypothetical protein